MLNVLWEFLSIVKISSKSVSSQKLLVSLCGDWSRCVVDLEHWYLTRLPLKCINKQVVKKI